MGQTLTISTAILEFKETEHINCDIRRYESSDVTSAKNQVCKEYKVRYKKYLLTEVRESHFNQIKVDLKKLTLQYLCRNFSQKIFC